MSSRSLMITTGVRVVVVVYVYWNIKDLLSAGFVKGEIHICLRESLTGLLAVILVDFLEL